MAVIVLVFLMLLAMSVAAPRVAMELKRERELESARRANQYVRAVQVYYGKFKHYPGSIEQLEGITGYRPSGRTALEIFQSEVSPHFL